MATGKYYIPQRLIEDIEDEREYQIYKRGFNALHDDKHDAGQIADAAAVYALNQHPHVEAVAKIVWPWHEPRAPMYQYKNRVHNYRRNLVMAAALLIAELERIDRATMEEEKAK